MLGLAAHAAALAAYVAGLETFEGIEVALRAEVAANARARARRWFGSEALSDDLAQVMTVALWRALDAFDPETGVPLVAWCGMRMDFEARRLIRSHRRSAAWIVDDAGPERAAPCALLAEVEVRHALRHVRDDGVRAFVLASLDTGADVVARIAADESLLDLLGWSDVEQGGHAARRRARRNEIVQDIVGGS